MPVNDLKNWQIILSLMFKFIWFLARNILNSMILVEEINTITVVDDTYSCLMKASSTSRRNVATSNMTPRVIDYLFSVFYFVLYISVISFDFLVEMSFWIVDISRCFELFGSSQLWLIKSSDRCQWLNSNFCYLWVTLFKFCH